jgi:hypothetical protein
MDPRASEETEIDGQISLYHTLAITTLMPETAIAPNSSEEQLPPRKSSKRSFAMMSIYISSVFGTYVFYNFCSDLKSMSFRDTVCSVGVFRNTSYPGADLADNICFFRHALALDERRVKFLPEYVVAKKEWFSAGEFGRPRCKEVWFRGSHSDV